MLQGLGDVAQLLEMLPRDRAWMQGWQGLAWSSGSCEEQILLVLGAARPCWLSPHEVSELSPPQLALLYEEVLYTIQHRLGRPEQQHVRDSQELYSYVQKVCPPPGRVPKTCPLTCPSSQLQGTVQVCYVPSSLSEILKGL